MVVHQPIQNKSVDNRSLIYRKLFSLIICHKWRMLLQRPEGEMFVKSCFNIRAIHMCCGRESVLHWETICHFWRPLWPPSVLTLSCPHSERYTIVSCACVFFYVSHHNLPPRDAHHRKQIYQGPFDSWEWGARAACLTHTFYPAIIIVIIYAGWRT